MFVAQPENPVSWMLQYLSPEGPPKDVSKAERAAVKQRHEELVQKVAELETMVRCRPPPC